MRHLESAADFAGPHALLVQLDDLLALMVGQGPAIYEDASQLIAPALAVPQHLRMVVLLRLVVVCVLVVLVVVVVNGRLLMVPSGCGDRGHGRA